MITSTPEVLQYGDLRVLSSTGDLPGDRWPELAAMILLDPEPPLLVRWTRRLEAGLGVTPAHRRAMERASFLTFPGEEAEATAGHRLIDLVTDLDRVLEWFAFRIGAGQDTRAEKALLEAGFTVYAPRMVYYDRIRGRRVRRERPLLPGYVFVGMAPGAGASALEGDFILDVVRAPGSGRPAPIAFAELEVILLQDRAGEFDRTRRRKGHDPEAGTPVEITGGTFTGFPAKFVMRRPDDRIEVMFMLFGRESPLVLDENEVGGLSHPEAD